MSLVLGLGNPGSRYERTRHNVGWRTVEMLVGRWKARPAERVEAYRSWSAEVAGHAVELALPLTFMNLSGQAIEAWRQRHALDPERLLVVADDVYLPIGTLRLRVRGSSGGHRGLESIEAVLGTREYARLRIGVGATDSERLREHVLEEPLDGEREELEASIERAADAVECWVGEGVLAAMNRFNRRAIEEGTET